MPQLGLDNDIAVRFIFPHAPQIPVTINGGMVMPAWYDILEMSLDRKIDVAQIEKSSQQIRDLIQREIERGVKPEHIVIAGFLAGRGSGLPCGAKLSTALSWSYDLVYLFGNQ